eukprot:jgi/Picre1/30173/NNA_005542.t1
MACQRFHVCVRACSSSLFFDELWGYSVSEYLGSCASNGAESALAPGPLLLAASLSYLFSKPGVLQGMVDTYFLAPLQRVTTPVYCIDDVKVGRKIASGGFGSVYSGRLVESDTPIILKKAIEFGEAEVWMNERIERHLQRLRRQSLFGKSLSVLPGPNRRAAAIRVIMKQVLEGLRACHNVGIVHRDFKPQNCVLAEKDNRFKLIDFGAAADLRVGINYVRTVFIRSAICSTRAMAFQPLRTDNGLIAFNKTLGDKFNGDLRAWRRSMEKKGAKEWVEGFQTLDALGGGGWDLAVKLVQKEPADRITATQLCPTHGLILPLWQQ